MRIEQDGWEPMLESEPSDNFVCNYEGPIAQKLELNRPAIEKFLSLASLGGQVVLTNSNFRRRQAYPDINPDGSVTNKGVLRFGERLHLPTRQPNEKFQVDLDGNGFRIAINGGMLLEELTKNKTVREAEKPFSQKFNYFLRASLKEALLKDKLTFASDPVFTGRIIITSMYFREIFRAIGDPTNFHSYYIFTDILLFSLYNLIARQATEQAMDLMRRNDYGRFWPMMYKLFYFGRRSVNNIPEGLFAPPFEIDRLALAYGYLDLQMIKRNPLIRIAPN